ncbi:type VI secretion system Vgr family protein [uncultured Paludibaculum sp.]|uniref:type VI secretion system Vgr family protein n=1 Tax=uncultured Paludibaculum sp. TaxID=1765020 RepID=UPI002AAB50D0|nr:type VI secretion system Vgr family protein [uncultured Paludibaculum sp.]
MPPIQGEWPIKLTTPLGADFLLPEGFEISEGISTLFRMEIEAVVTPVEDLVFDRLLGQKVTIELKMPNDTSRYFNGIVSRIAQGHRTYDAAFFTLEVVPKFWLMTRVERSRIFQQKTVPDILKEVLGADAQFQLVGTFEPREYCVQYRESDFAFASRLMEEEGIFYFFKHSDGDHKMIVANSPAKHTDVADPKTVIYEELRGGTRAENRISVWTKSQEIQSGKVTLWDHTFEIPAQNLEATKTIMETAAAGTVTHKLNAGGAASLELYDYPGGYAKRFDGVSKSGGDQAGNLQKIFTDNTRTVEIRMQSEAVNALTIQGESNCMQLSAGSKFELDRHFSDNGTYVLTSVQHSARHPMGSERSMESFTYTNSFTCIPQAVPYRPPRVTPIPTVRGTQTAVVVGPAGEEIYPDKYSRVKVQFHWDREGRKDANSSCWVRVATLWAGKQWGMIHIPRIGQEVIVDFLEGDPDRPIIVGSVFNAEQMPPYTLPDNKTQSGIKTRSSKQGTADNCNEFRFEDKKGSEEVYLHAEKDMLVEVENDEVRKVDHDRTTTIKNDETKTVTDGNETITIKTGKQTITIQGDQTLLIKQGNQSTTLDMGNQSTKLKMGNQTTKIDLGKAETEAMQSIELKVGQSSIKVDQMGVTIKGMMIKIEGQIQVQVKGLMTQINGDAMLTEKGGIVMIN